MILYTGEIDKRTRFQQIIVRTKVFRDLQSRGQGADFLEVQRVPLVAFADLTSPLAHGIRGGAGPPVLR